MAFHTSLITCLPQELILYVFNMFTNITDIINFAESQQYVFNIYKANIDRVVKQLFNNNKNNGIINYVIYGVCWNAHYSNTTISIDTKLDIVKKMGNYLSNIDNAKMLEYIQLFKKSYNILNYNSFPLKKLLCNFYYLQVVKGHNFDIAHYSSYLTLNKYNKFIYYVNLGNNYMECYRMIQKLNDHQIELMQTYIDRGLSFTDAVYVVENISESNVDKVFELYEQYSISIITAIIMIDEFTQLQIEKTQQLINDGIDSDSAFNLVKNFNDAEIDLFIKLYNILIKDTDDDIDNLSFLITENHRNESELNIMIKLAENNFKTDDIIYITNELVDNDDYEEYSIMKCIELKNKGIREYHIHSLVEAGIHKDFDYEYYESLIKNNHTPEEAINMIINEHEN